MSVFAANAFVVKVGRTLVKMSVRNARTGVCSETSYYVEISSAYHALAIKTSAC